MRLIIAQRLVRIHPEAPYGKLAQLAEHAAVNRSVTGSSPVFPARCPISYVHIQLVKLITLLEVL